MKLLCLANATKDGARCIAGVTTSGRWVRPVSDLAHGEVTSTTCTMDNGSVVDLLDWVEVPLGDPVPIASQPENVAIAPGRWRHLGHLDAAAARARLDPLVSTESDIFGDRKTWVPLPGDEPFDESLLLIKPTDVQWYVTTGWNGGRQLRAWFQQGEAPYDLPVTDIAFKEKTRPLTFGVHDSTGKGLLEPADYYFTMSLAPFEPRERCFKLVAAVIGLPRP